MLVLCVVVLTGCAAPDSGPRTVPTSSAVLRVVAVGDSITEADSPDFDGGLIGDGSWARWAEGDGVDVSGGWAHGGATTEDVLDGVQPMSADADVLVLMAGSNDVDLDVPTVQVLQQLTDTVAVADVARVVLSTIPPEDGHEDDVAALNSELAGLADREGWQFVDPMTGVRGSDGGWLPGDSDDGVHPTIAAARVIGTAIRAALLAG